MPLYPPVVSDAEPFVTIGNPSTLSAERAITGTTNQVIVTDNGANSTVVLSLPQNIHTDATPTFDALTLDKTTGNTLVVDTNTLVVDASNNYVGIGTTAPEISLHLYATTDYLPQVLVHTDANSNAGAYWNTRKSRAGAAAQVGDGIGTFVFQVKTSGGSVVNGGYFGVAVSSVGASTAGVTYVYSTDSTGAIKFALTEDGRIYGSALHNNSGAVTGTTNQYIASGTYTATLTNIANLAASSGGQGQWLRVGNVVTVSIAVSVDPTLTATSTQLGISLPIASNFTGTPNCGGVMFASNIAGQGAAIFADPINDRAQMQWISTDITAQSMYGCFTYVIL